MHAYLDIARILRREIADGHHPAGAPMPDRAGLAARFGVDDAVIRAALRLLAAGRLVAPGRVGGAPGLIAQPYPDAAVPPGDHDEPGEPPWRSRSVRVTFAPAGIAHRLGVDPGLPVVVREEQQATGGRPGALRRVYIPRDLAERTGLAAPHDLHHSITRRLTDHGHHESRHVDDIGTERADERAATALAAAAGTLLLVRIRTSGTSAGVTRVTWTARVCGTGTLRYELGDGAGLAVLPTRR
jgi:GntR family transcriptional regulator